MRRKNSLFRLVLPALVVGGVLYVTQTLPIWPFQRGPALPPARISSISDSAREAYDGLQSDFRAMVPLGEFAAMFERMKDWGCGEAPKLADAQAIEPTGAEPLLARFRVEDPAGQAGGEYEFARLDGVWRLQNYAREPRRLSRTQRSTPAFSEAPLPKPAERKAAPGPNPPIVAAPKVAGPSAPPGSWPHTYVIQPGDRLETISRQLYGTSRYWRRILEANPGLDPKRLNIGRRIAIPAPPEQPPEHMQEPEAAPETPRR